MCVVSAFSVILQVDLFKGHFKKQFLKKVTVPQINRLAFCASSPSFCQPRFSLLPGVSLGGAWASPWAPPHRASLLRLGFHAALAAPTSHFRFCALQSIS